MAERGPPQSFSLTAGETMEIDFVADGDINGATVGFWMARNPGDTPLLSTDDATAVGVVTQSPNFTVIVEDEQTEALLGTYVYEVELQDGAGNRSKAAYGYLTFHAQVQP